MSYDDHLPLRRWVAAALAVVASVAALIAATQWLLPAGKAIAPLDEPARGDAEDPAPGAIVCTPPPTSSGVVTASTLIDCPDLYDGRAVVFRGEVIGPVFTRAGHAVATLNDDDYGLRAGPLPETRTALGGNAGIAVVMPAEVRHDVTYHGSYRARGDILRVEGTFAADSDVLGGLPAIHATTVTVDEAGYAIDHRVRRRTVIAAIVSMGVAASVGAARRRSRSHPLRR